MNLNNLDINSVATLVSCFLSAYFGFKISEVTTKNPLKIHSYKKQFSLVYLPLFKEIYPFMYSEISYEQAKHLVFHFNEIVSNNFELVNPNLISAFLKFQKSLNVHYVSQKDFKKICLIVDNDFENLRKSLALPSRNFIYKYKNGEISNKWFTITYPRHFYYKVGKFLLCLLISLIVFIGLNVTMQAINDGAFSSFENFLNYNL